MYVHHVGGRGGTISFPSIAGFQSEITPVIYEADPEGVAEIQQRWGSSALVLPVCLGDARATTPFFLNYCRFTSSVFPFNEQYAHYYEEKRAGYSDYVFGKSFSPEQKLLLETEAIDTLSAEGRIPRVDFLSIDTQGSELAILKGAEGALTRDCVGVACEVSFVELYEGVPVFGEIDAFLRARGFLLADIAPMRFGYKRIARNFRGRGMPLQGEALYLLEPSRIASTDAGENQRRLERLAFAALAFGFTELAFEAVERSRAMTPAAAERGPIAAFLGEFADRVNRDATLPPLWHEYIERVPGAEDARGGRVRRLINRFRTDRHTFFMDVRRVFDNAAIRALSFLNAQKLGFNAFESFLNRAGFESAAREVYSRRQK